MTKLTSQPAWKALLLQAEHMKSKHMRQLFADNPNRFKHFSLQLGDLLLDYSKNISTNTTMDTWMQLAREQGVPHSIKRMFDGKKINNTEKRAVLHTALRNRSNQPIKVDGLMDGSFANQVLAQMHLFEKKYADMNDADKAANLIVEVLPKKLDEEVAADMVAGFGGVITKLTQEQADYINVPVEGPFKPDNYKY